jgi:hypothetical protein
VEGGPLTFLLYPYTGKARLPMGCPAYAVNAVGDTSSRDQWIEKSKKKLGTHCWQVELARSPTVSTGISSARPLSLVLGFFEGPVLFLSTSVAFHFTAWALALASSAAFLAASSAHFLRIGETDQMCSVVMVLVVVVKMKKKFIDLFYFHFSFSTVMCLVGSALRGKYCYICNSQWAFNQKPGCNSVWLYIYITLIDTLRACSVAAVWALV